MKLGVCAQALYHLPFEEALRTARDLGFEAIELPVDRRNPFVDLEELLAGGWQKLQQTLQHHGLTLSAVSNHQEGQLLLGPHGKDTDPIFQGSPAEKVEFATRRLLQCAELAQRLEVTTVIGFTGCEDYSRWFPWPLADGYERMAVTFRERLLPILDAYQARGVHFAHECHPRQFAYNLETAQWAMELVDQHPSLGFNLDPANLLLAGMDPIQFAVELGMRVCHVHAKDGESVGHTAGRSGLLAHGPWQRPGRGFRFRVAGWGQIDWRALITELHVHGFQGVFAVEHEDPTMSQGEGLRQAAQFLRPLLLHEPAPGTQPWW